MTTVLLVIHFFIAAFLVISILLQRSEGGALGGLGGGSGLMTARGQANLLTKITSVLVAAFFLSSILIAILLRSPEGGRSVLDKPHKSVAVETTTRPATEENLTAQPHTEGENPPVEMPAQQPETPKKD